MIVGDNVDTKKQKASLPAGRETVAAGVTSYMVERNGVSRPPGAPVAFTLESYRRTSSITMHN